MQSGDRRSGDAGADVAEERAADVERRQRSTRRARLPPLMPISTCRLFGRGQRLAGVGVARHRRGEVERHVGARRSRRRGPSSRRRAGRGAERMAQRGERRGERLLNSRCPAQPSVASALRCRAACGARRARAVAPRLPKAIASRSESSVERSSRFVLGVDQRRARAASTSVPSTLPVPAKLNAEAWKRFSRPCAARRR